MNIVCFGLSHQQAGVEVREAFALSEAASVEAARRVCGLEWVEEAVVLSTCNRTEYYAVTTEAEARELCARHFATDAPAGVAQFYHHDGSASIEHLFRVVCGLESMVLGETEILGQVKKAYQAANAHGTTSRFLNKLFQRAFLVAKQVRTRTGIARGSVSVGSVGVDLAEQIFGSLRQRKVMILGAGETGELTARSLLARGVHSLFVSNRSYDRAAALAQELSGRAVHFDAWENEMHDVDILITSTAAPHHIVTGERLRPVLATRTDRPLFIIDLAVPRDVEPAVNDLEGVYLYDIDSLQRIAGQALARRQSEMQACETMIREHVEEFRGWLAREEPRVGWQRFLDRHRERQLTKLSGRAEGGLST